MVELVCGLHHVSPKVVKLVHGLYQESPKVVELKVGVHHGCLGGDHGCLGCDGANNGASPWESNGGEARTWASPKMLH